MHIFAFLNRPLLKTKLAEKHLSTGMDKLFNELGSRQRVLGMQMKVRAGVYMWESRYDHKTLAEGEFMPLGLTPSCSYYKTKKNFKCGGGKLDEGGGGDFIYCCSTPL